jgi:amino acid transporter
MASGEKEPALVRGLGLWQATALNVTMIVGAGVFVTIPGMLGPLPGPYALLGWLGAGALILIDGLVWGELGATLPGSGGSYRYLLECYGPERWGRLAAFLFIWQFLLSGPLELGSGLAAMALFFRALSPRVQAFDEAWTKGWTWEPWQGQQLSVSFGPSRFLAFGLGVLIVALLRGRITTLGRLTVVLWVGVLGVIAWVLVAGWLRFDPACAFDFSGRAAKLPNLPVYLGPAMVLAMYAYLGYYNVCYVGDEVRDPGRTIPRAILLSAAAVVVLFAGLHLAMLGTVPWREVPLDSSQYVLPADFMGRAEGPVAVAVLMALLIGCCFGSAFCGLLGYSRIPYGAARQGHFFAALARVDPVRRVPQTSLLLVGGLMLFWTFFDLTAIINALIATRILEQFIGQAVGVMLLRHRRPDLDRPWKMPLYPLPCLAAMAGWLYLYASSGLLFVSLGATTLAVGVVVFFVWSWRTGVWPFTPPAKEV